MYLPGLAFVESGRAYEIVDLFDRKARDFRGRARALKKLARSR